MASAHKEIIHWHIDSLPRAAKRALDFLSKKQWMRRSQWYLAGGTALSLYAGHRQSVDLDFFIPKSSFYTNKIIGRLGGDNWETDIIREGTVYGKLFGAKVSFIAYPFFHAEEAPWYYGAVRVLKPQDIAVMKIIAISQRGKKRDFVDLYWYSFHQEPLIAVLRRLPSQYPTVAHDYHHILKSLMYFEDAENDPMPKLFFKADWKKIKQYFNRVVPAITKELLKLR